MSHAPQPTPSLLDATIRVPEHVVYRSFGDRIVLLNIQTCRYHGLNPTGGRMLEVLDETNRIAVAAERVASEFDVPVERVQADLLALCEQLERHGLIEATR